MSKFDKGRRLTAETAWREPAALSGVAFRQFLTKGEAPGPGGVEETEQFGIDFRRTRMPGKGQHVLTADCQGTGSGADAGVVSS